MSSILMIALGILMIVCPENYVTTMVGTLGCILLVAAVLGVFEFLGSNKSLIQYFYLTLYLVMGVVGTVIILFEMNSLYTICILFGAYLILSGLSNLSSAVMYVKRSGHKGWGFLVLLALSLIVCGVIILINPWWDTSVSLFNVVGVMIIYSSLVSILRLIWLWPIKG